jgi:hypothetical protein
MWIRSVDKEKGRKKMSRYCCCIVAVFSFFLLYNAPAVALNVCPVSEPDNKLVIGEQTRVPILIDEPSGVAAFGFVLKYDTTKVNYVAIEKTGITDHFIVLDGADSDPRGQVTIGGFGTPGISVSNPDTLCYVVFGEIVDEPDPQKSCIEMHTFNFVDDIASSPDCYTRGCFVPAENTTWGRIKALWSD